MEGSDYISRLPDSSLLHILRFLSTVDAARTVCVPRFRYLWKSSPTLSFSLCEFHRCREWELNQMQSRERFIYFVDSALILHNRPTLDRFSLSMEFFFIKIGTDLVNGMNGICSRRVSSIISSWIRFALKKEVKILNLDFTGCQVERHCEHPELEYYVLPSILLKSTSLVELYLDGCNVKLFGGIELKSLRILSLTRVRLSNQMVNQILCGCLLLEEMSLKKCSGLDRMNISEPTHLRKLNVVSATMTELDIALSSIEFLQVHARLMEKINCPTITHLDVEANAKLVRFSDLPSLVEATVFLDITDILHDTEYQGVRLLLQKLRNVRSLSACALCILVFSTWTLAPHPHPCFNWTSVTTAVGFTKWANIGVARLLKSSPYLERLVIYAFPSSSFTDASPGDLTTERRRSSRTIDCLKDHLKNITIRGDITKPYILGLIKFLLENALVLEKMVISSESPPERYRKQFQYDTPMMQDLIPPISMNELSRLVSGFSKASAAAEIRYV